MAAVLIIPELGAVTLRTQRHRVFPGHRFSISQMQACVAIVYVVTGDARQLSVLKLESLVEFIQI